MNRSIATAFALGAMFAACLFCMIEDFLGLQAYVTAVQNGWVDLPWQLPAAGVLVSAVLFYRLARRQNAWDSVGIANDHTVEYNRRTRQARRRFNDGRLITIDPADIVVDSETMNS